MKTPLRTIMAVASTAGAAVMLLALLNILNPDLFAAPSPAGEKGTASYRTNNIPTAWTTVVGAANSNVTGFGNSGGYTAAQAVRLPYQQPIGVYVSFSCATVTLANASCVLQTSADSNLWQNLPGNTFTISTGASAASANNTNVCVYTNFTAAQLAGANWIRVASTTNGNIPSITSLRVLLTYP